MKSDNANPNAYEAPEKCSPTFTREQMMAIDAKVRADARAIVTAAEKRAAAMRVIRITDDLIDDEGRRVYALADVEESVIWLRSDTPAEREDECLSVARQAAIGPIVEARHHEQT